MTLSLKKRWHAQATALGLTFAVIYIVVVILMTLYPELMVEYLNTTFHGLALQQVPEVTVSTFIVGLITNLVTGYVVGTIHSLIVHGIEQSK